MSGTEEAVGVLGGWLVVKKLVAGGLAGAAAKTAVAPADRCKILMQVALNFGGGREVSVSQTFRDVLRTDGVAGFWRGNSAVVLRIAPYAAIQFSSFEWYSRHTSPMFAAESAWLHRFACGGLAGMTSVLATYPLDLIRTRLAVQHAGSAPYRGVGDAFASILRLEGWRGLYRGVGTTLFGIIPYAGVNFAAYGMLKRQLSRQRSAQSHPILTSLLAGSGAGLLAQSATYPVDVVRRRMQVVSFLGQGKHLLPQSNPCSMWSALVHVVRHEGFFALYRGLSINYLKAAPAIAISFTTYDYLKRRWGVPESKYSATSV